jgi:hypothetical protein
MSRILSQKTIAIFFALLFAVALFTPFIQADAPNANSKVSKKTQKAKKTTKSGTEILSEVMDIVSAFGGDAIGGVIDEFTANLQQTSELLQSLAHPDTIDSINFLIENLLKSLGEAALKASSDNGAGETMQSSDFGEYLESVKSILIKRCKTKTNFPPSILSQIEMALPALFQGLSEMYKNIFESTRFGLTFGLLAQGTSFLSIFDRREYVSKDTFQQFVNFPDEIKHQFETVVEELIASYIDPAQLDMMLGMAKMYAKNFASRRGEHDEL